MTTSLETLRRSLVGLRAPKPRVYFTDLALTSAAVYGGIAFAGATSAPGSFALGVVFSALALSRAALFVHELAHQRNAVRGLRLAWHLVIGIPFLFPSFIYEHLHRQHHRLAVYRTELDPEHAPSTRSTFARIVSNQLAALFLPLVLLVRWAIVTPLSFAIPSGRRWVLRRFSSLTMNPKYVPPARLGRTELLAEVACMVWGWLLIAMVLSGTIPVRGVIAAWIALGIAVGITDIRGEALHQFGPDVGGGTLERQVRDSVDLHARGFVRLLYPMGIGFHALHHLAPWLPYHAMGEAHARVGDHVRDRRTTFRRSAQVSHKNARAGEDSLAQALAACHSMDGYASRTSKESR